MPYSISHISEFDSLNSIFTQNYSIPTYQERKGKEMKTDIIYTISIAQRLIYYQYYIKGWRRRKENKGAIPTISININWFLRQYLRNSYKNTTKVNCIISRMDVTRIYGMAFMDIKWYWIVQCIWEEWTRLRTVKCLVW